MQLEKKYNGKTYSFDVGTYENNRMPIRIGLDHLSDKGQPQGVIGRKIIIDLDDEGMPVQVVTRLEHQEFFNDGSICRSRCFTEDYRMADEEMPEFAARLGQPIRLGVYNMYARGGKPGQRIGLGQNNHPPFDSASTAFNPEEVNTLGTFDYPHDKVHEPA